MNYVFILIIYYSKILLTAHGVCPIKMGAGLAQAV
jgi:hypothetical protein